MVGFDGEVGFDGGDKSPIEAFSSIMQPSPIVMGPKALFRRARGWIMLEAEIVIRCVPAFGGRGQYFIALDREYAF